MNNLGYLAICGALTIMQQIDPIYCCVTSSTAPEYLMTIYFLSYSLGLLSILQP